MSPAKSCPGSVPPPTSQWVWNRQGPASQLSITQSCCSNSSLPEHLSHQSSLQENKQGVLGKDLVIVNNVRPFSSLSFHVKIFRRTWRSHTWQVLEYLWHPDQTWHLLLYVWSKWSLELMYTSCISICSFFYIYLICIILFSCIWIHSYLFLGLFWYPKGFSGKFPLGWPQGLYFLNCTGPQQLLWAAHQSI